MHADASGNSDMLGLVRLAEALDEGERSRYLVAQLVSAEDHVSRGRAIVAEQRSRIQKLAARGFATDQPRRVLDVFVAVQGSFEDHERLLRAEMEAST